MASIRQVNKRYKATVSKRIDGKLKQISKTFDTMREARLWASRIEADQSLGAIKASKNILFSDYFKEWYTTYKAPKVAPITLSRYKIVYKVLKNNFKGVKLDKMNRTKYQRFINEYGASHAKDTVHKLNALVRSCVKSALLDEVIAKDFTQGIELVYNTNKTRKVDYLEYDELMKLTELTASKLNHNFTSRYIILTAIFTGARISEILALTWKDIDFKNNTITINKSWDYHFKTGFKPTKTAASNRTISAPQLLLGWLKQLQGNDKKMVFTNQYGTLPTPTAVNKTLRKLLKECGLHKKNFHFHSLRHTHVAYLLYNGVDIYVISQRLGHSDISVTTKKYAYLLNKHTKKENDKINSALDQLVNKKISLNKD
ncbi:tyrosine-type recombinase/integrase [Ligilactobacillus saerimneri]|nr:site-specific integrase [Ligilactobacillus saerimneri]